VGLTSALPAHVFLPGVHMVASLLKRWLTGTLHYAASQDHLDYYLDEYTPSASTGAQPRPEACSSTACSNKQSTPTPTP